MLRSTSTMNFVFLQQPQALSRNSPRFFFLLVVGGTLNEISGSLCKCVSVVRFVVVGTINKLMACVCLFSVYMCV